MRKQYSDNEMAKEFNRIYAQDLDTSYYRYDAYQIHPFVESAFFPGASAIDLGCGDGRYSVGLANLGFAVTAVDLSAIGVNKLRAEAKKQGFSNISTAVGDVLSDSLELDTFDLVLASTILNHLSSDQVAMLIERIYGAVERGSAAYISVFTEDDPGSQHDVPSQVASETSVMLKYYFKKGELLSRFEGAGKVLLYEETVEEDASHGCLHVHGIARIGISR